MSGDYSVELAGYVFRGPSARSLDDQYSGAIRAVYKQHGPKAFEQPRSATIAHELSHAIVGHHDGARVDRISIWSNPDPLNGGLAWAGEMAFNDRRRRRLHGDMPIADLLAAICLVIAGKVGETTLDRENSREGSSLDEVIVSQLIAAFVGDRLNVNPRAVCSWCRTRTAALLAHNKVAAAELTRLLMKCPSVRGTPLRSALNLVRPLPGGSLDKLTDVIKSGLPLSEVLAGAAG